MLGTSNYNNPFTPPDDAVEKKSDTKIRNDENRHDFLRRNIFKWVVLILTVIGLCCVAGLFLWKFFTDSRVQEYVIEQIVNNIVFIILSIFAILKINVPNIHK